jgi:hypothetical protein
MLCYDMQHFGETESIQITVFCQQWPYLVRCSTRLFNYDTSCTSLIETTKFTA